MSKVTRLVVCEDGYTYTLEHNEDSTWYEVAQKLMPNHMPIASVDFDTIEWAYHQLKSNRVEVKEDA